MSHDTFDDTEASDVAWATVEESPVSSYPGLRRPNRAVRWNADTRRRSPRDEEHVSGEPRARPAVPRQRPGRPETFRCRHCRTLVGPVPSGGRHRNHCPICLYSRHVDERLPGDRLSACGGSMAPLGMFIRPNGEHTLVHRCLSCGVERHNRVAADDDFTLVLDLPDLTRRLPDRQSAAGVAESSA